MGYKVTEGAHGTKQVRKNGKIVNNLPAPHTPAPPAVTPKTPAIVEHDTSPLTLTTVETAYQTFENTTTNNNEHHTALDAKGEEAPALSVEVDDGKTRLYITNPNHAEYVQLNPDQALEEGIAYPSITTCMKQVGDTDGHLQRWAVNQTAQEASRAVEKIQKVWEKEGAKKARKELETLLEKTSDNKTFISAWLSNTDSRTSQQASQRGTEVHAIIESLARGEDIPPAEELPVHVVGYVRAYERFRAQFPDLDVAYTEVTVVNEDDRYAGTADIILKDPQGNYYAGDYKTNKYGRIYDKTGMQLAAVAKASYIITPTGEKLPLPKIVGGIGVGLSPKGECNVTAFPVEPYYARFKNAVTMWFSERKAKNNPDDNARSAKVNSTRDILSFMKK